MNYVKLLLLASVIATPVIPMSSRMKIGDSAWFDMNTDEGLKQAINYLKDSPNDQYMIFKGSLVHDGQKFICNACTGIVKETKGLMTRIIECYNGTCTEGIKHTISEMPQVSRNESIKIENRFTGGFSGVVAPAFPNAIPQNTEAIDTIYSASSLGRIKEGVNATRGVMGFSKNGDFRCVDCSGIAKITKGQIIQIITCIQGNCKETDYNTLTGTPLVPQSIPQRAPNMTIIGLIKQHPLIAAATIATGAYAGYKLYKWLQKPKKQ